MYFYILNLRPEIKVSAKCKHLTMEPRPSSDPALASTALSTVRCPSDGDSALCWLKVGITGITASFMDKILVTSVSHESKDEFLAVVN